MIEVREKLTDTDIAAEIEGHRRKARILNITGVVLFLACVIIALIVLLGSDGNNEIDFSNLEPRGIAALVATGLGVIGSVLLFIGKHYKKKLKQLVSEHLVRGVLEEFFTLDTYDTNMHIPESIIKTAGMTGSWERARGSDYVKGTYKSIAIQFSDIHLINVATRRDSDGDYHESESTVFQGPWLTCDFGIKFPAKLIVREKRAKLIDDKHKKDSNRPETEDEAFIARYEVLTSDQHMASSILTPHFMKKIQEINNKSGGKLLLCFEGNHVHIAVYNKHDSFEVSSKTSEFQDLDILRDRFRTEIRYLTDIIDELTQNIPAYK